MDIAVWAREHFGEPLSVNRVHWCIYKCTLALKERAIFQQHPGTLLAQAHLRWWKNVLRCHEFTFHIAFRNHGHRVLWVREKKDHPDCFQCKDQKPVSVMVWGCVNAHGMGNRHISEGTINAEKYIEVLEQHMLPSTTFSGMSLLIFSKTMARYILHVLQQCGLVVKPGRSLDYCTVGFRVPSVYGWYGLKKKHIYQMLRSRLGLDDDIRLQKRTILGSSRIVNAVNLKCLSHKVVQEIWPKMTKRNFVRNQHQKSMMNGMMKDGFRSQLLPTTSSYSSLMWCAWSRQSIPSGFCQQREPSMHCLCHTLGII